MADSGLLVTISGAALSLLLYENVRSVGDQMGFLLGETLKFVVKKFTDSDNQVETVKIHINIETVVTCPAHDLLYNSIGKLNKEKLKDLIQDKGKEIIGWFRFRQNSSLTPTMRDKVLHKEFASHFCNDNGTRKELFLTCLLSSSTSSMKGTHKFRHVFLRQKCGIFEPIPLRINNLGYDASKHDGSEYKLTPATKSLDEPDTFTKLIDSLKLDLNKTPGVESVTCIQKAAEQHLNTLIPKVCETDREVAELERQVKELRRKISTCNLVNKSNINGNANIVDTDHESDRSSDNNASRISERHDLSPPRTSSPGKVCDDGHSFQDCSTSVNQTITSHKTRHVADTIVKSVNQERSRRTGSSTETQNSASSDPFGNITPEVKKNPSEQVMTRSRRSIAKQPIGDQNEVGLGRGRGIGSHEFTPRMKMPRSSTSSVNFRYNTERNSVGQFSNVEYHELISNSPSLPAYSPGTRKDASNARSISDMSD